MLSARDPPITFPALALGKQQHPSYQLCELPTSLPGLCRVWGCQGALETRREAGRWQDPQPRGPVSPTGGLQQ